MNKIANITGAMSQNTLSPWIDLQVQVRTKDQGTLRGKLKKYDRLGMLIITDHTKFGGIIEDLFIPWEAVLNVKRFG